MGESEFDIWAMVEMHDGKCIDGEPFDLQVTFAASAFVRRLD